jgi:hypothetical protein
MEQLWVSGDYVVNYGFLTAHVNAVWTHTVNTFRNEDFSIGDPTPASSPRTKSWTAVHDVMRIGGVRVRYYLRRSIENLFSAKLYNGLNLTSEQLPVLSALFSKYSPR